MKVSLNWVKEFINFQLPSVEELQLKIGAQLGAIEDTEYLGDKYKGIVIVNVVSCVEHTNSDHLHVCLVDDGGIVPDVPRDANGHVQVVCGAVNVRAGMLAVWLPPQTVVPETYGKEPFSLEAREFRGEMSVGMLASARELGLGNDHTGIVEINPHDAKPGDDFAKIYKLDDYIIDIENKMFTHRPDCFGELGLAREIAGILHQPFVSPDWYTLPLPNPLERSGDQLPLTVTNEIPELVPRFITTTLHIGHLGPSPVWLQTYLSRLGLRPISNVVDITNYMMLLTAQPLHAYDYDKVKKLSSDAGPSLVVRHPRPGEKLKLLNGKEIEPREEAIMIATDKQLIGVGGVMGGFDTEVDENTKNVILECGTFDMYSIRRTAMAHGLFTDAVTRFNKGQSPLQNDRVVGQSLQLFGQLTDATQAGDIQDDNHVKERKWVHPPVPVTAAYINERLGLKLTAEEMKHLLENVEFSVAIDGEVLTITAPFWRTDIELREDIVEEVGRLYGYDQLPLDLPLRTLAPVQKDGQLELKAAIREKLASSGANEVLTYSFVHGNLLDKVGQDKVQAFRLSNAISPDLQYYRLSLMPSVLDLVHQNIKTGYDSFAVFELGLVHHKTTMDPGDTNVPQEDAHLALVFTANDKAAQKPAGAAYYEARHYLNALLPVDNLELVSLKGFDFKDDVWGQQLCAPYEPNRSAVVVRDGLAWGIIGEFKLSVTKALKLPAYTSGFEIGLELLRQPKRSYEPLPRFPKVEQDICLKVDSAKTYREVYTFVKQTLDESKPEQTKLTLAPIDIYQRNDDKAHKQITLRLTIASYERTLTDGEVAHLLDDVATQAKEKLGAERV